MDPASVVELWKVGGITLVFLVALIYVTSMFISHLKEQNKTSADQIERLITALEQTRAANDEHAETNRQMKASLDSFTQQFLAALSFLKGQGK